MNDELLLKQLNEVVPQEDMTRQIYASADDRALPQTLHARTWASERTQHIVWELPAEPRFQVARGGLRRDWKWVRPIMANITFLTFLILTLVFWPHTRPRPTSSASPSELQQPSPNTPQRLAVTPSVAYNTYNSDWQSGARGRADIPPAYHSSRPMPSLYAGNSVRDYAPVRATVPVPTSAYRVANFRVAPSAPIAGSVPPLQSPY